MKNELNQEIKTLQQCKDQVAREHKYDDFNHACLSLSGSELWPKIAVLYADQFKLIHSNTESNNRTAAKEADKILSELKKDVNHISKQLNEGEEISYNTGFFKGYEKGIETIKELQEENKNIRTAIDALDKVRVLKSETIKLLTEALEKIKIKSKYFEDHDVMMYNMPEINEIAKSALEAKPHLNHGIEKVKQEDK